MSTKPRQFYFNEDGKLYVAGAHGETPGLAEPGDAGFVGGGYTIKPRMGEDGSVVQEIVSSASGGTFYDDRVDIFAFQDDAFRGAVQHRRQFLDEGYRLWKYDPLGGIIVKLTTFFVMGRGLTITYNDETANAVLLKWWAKNNMHARIKQICDEGTAFGENYIGLRLHKVPVKIGRRIIWHPGDVELITYDPKIIEGIEHSADNVNDVRQYFISYTGENGEEVQRAIPDISRFDPDQHDECILHIKFNAANNDAFGLSDLVRIKEWLDNYQDFLRDSVIINKLYRSPCYDIKIIDGDETDIQKAVGRYSGWKIGANAVHNDKEEWNVLEFTGANMSQEDSRRALLLIVAAGVGLPEYMLADGSNSNLASTRSQQLPAIKKFEDRQDTYKENLKRIFEFILDMKNQFAQGNARPIPEADFEGDRIWRGEIHFPEIAREEDSVVAQYTTSLIEAGLISQSTAALKNGYNLDEEVARMEVDALKIGQAVKETLDKLLSLGIDETVAQQIVNKSFIAVHTIAVGQEQSEEDPDQGGGEERAPANSEEST